MYLWAVLISGCALAVAFIDGGTLETVVVGGAVAVLVATVLPRLIRDRSPRGSDRLSVLGNGARGQTGPPPPADGEPPSDGAPPSDGVPPSRARVEDAS
jgi:hypothetical protein